MWCVAHLALLPLLVLISCAWCIRSDNNVIAALAKKNNVFFALLFV